MEFCDNFHHTLSRRDMLSKCCAGFGGMALTSLLADETIAAPDAVLSPLAPRPAHFAPRARRIIFLFMHGGPSQVDTFDYKPMLTKYDDKPLPFTKSRLQFAKTGNLLKSPWKFKQYGQSGAWVSDLFPRIATCVDDLCFIKSIHGSNSAHGGAMLKLHTGSDNFIRPGMGAWVTYGLGTENQNLPGFITICPSGSKSGAWSSAFLPASYHGTPIGNSGIPSAEATIHYLANHKFAKHEQRAQLDMLKWMNEHQLAGTGPDHALEGRIESFETAFRMQTEAPEVMSIDGESEAMKKLYGLDDPKSENFGRQCLMARRFAESGVRFIQCTHSYKWDQHVDLQRLHTKNAKEVDQPIAGLIKDLKSRGMLDDTLVLWGGEFGRTPMAEGRRNGRDHNPHGFTMFMAGGGVKPGFSYGETDDFGYYAVKDKVHLHDLHATMLHLLGLDHKRLTYRHAGRDFRLTDVAGDVKYGIFS